MVSTDAVAHELLKPNTDLGQQIIRFFGPEVLKDGEISRRVLADKAFKDLKQLRKLEEFLHPAVLRRVEKLYAAACKKGSYSAFVVEIPLLFEIGAEPFYDVIVAVISDEAKARKRFEQAGFQETEYDLRMNRQLKPEEKASRSNYAIQNNGSLEDLRQEVIQLNRTIHNQ